MRNYFIFGGVWSSDFGVFISGANTFNAASRDFETVTIKGRDGVLTLDNGRFNEVDHNYSAFILDDFNTNISAFRNAIMSLRGMQRLTDSYHPGEFYRAYYGSGLEPDVLPNLRHGSFDVTFTRDPRRFLTSGEIAITNYIDADINSFTIDNPTPYASRPLIRVYGEGTIGVNGEPVKINFAPNAYTEIDSELQEIYYETTNLGMFVELDEFPVLAPGTNTITVSGGIIRVTVVPRWFIL